MMKYVSTRGGGEPQTFEQVLLSGLAPDGGLYVPESWPSIDVASLKGKSYTEIAFTVMYPFVEGCIPREDFKAIIEQTYSPEFFRHEDIVPLHALGERLYVMEQFHGPTIAFKDVALQLLGRLFDYVLSKRDERITIVGATSGDTGSAAIEGCMHSDRIAIFILHPEGRVSDVQRKQMTSINQPNVFNIALDGSFDDCQNMVKAMFADEAFRSRVQLSAVNSINWARIMAQIVYYFASAVKLGAPEEKVSFVVPTGNFGNVLAAYCAKQMGLDVGILGISTNNNDILTRFFETGDMALGQSFATLSPSMDIQISSNFERYLYFLYDRDSAKISDLMTQFKAEGRFAVDGAHMEKARAEFCAARADDGETLSLIRSCYDAHGYILDPHTAVGMKGAQEILSSVDGAVVLLSTAHPAKFPDAVEKAIGQRPDLPEHLAGLMEREEFVHVLPNDHAVVSQFVLDHYQDQ